MINGITPAQPAEFRRAAAVERGAPAQQVAAVGRDAAPIPTPAAGLAAQGAPVDHVKVAQLKAAIADGSYTVDPDAIADKMIALDLNSGNWGA